MSRPTVFFDEQIFLQQSYGGISRYFCELTKSLSVQKDIELVKIIAPFTTNSYIQGLPSHLKKSFLELPLSLQRPSLRMLRIPSQLIATHIIRQAKPALLHETYYRSHSQVLPGITRITTIHDMIHELHPELFPNSVQTIKAKRASINRSDGIICVSNQTRSDLLSLYDIDPSRVAVINHGVDHSYFSQPKVSVDNTTPPYLLFIGQRSGYKSFDLLLSAFSSSRILVPHLQIVAFGGGPPSSTELKRLHELKLEKKVRFVTGNERVLLSLYRGAECLVYPSLYEGFGMPILEAMASGCPVIYSDSNVLREVSGSCALGFVPGSVDSLATVIEKMACNPTLKKYYRSLGYSHATKFTWNKTAQDTIRFYNRMLQAKD